MVGEGREQQEQGVQHEKALGCCLPLSEYSVAFVAKRGSDQDSQRCQRFSIPMRVCRSLEIGICKSWRQARVRPEMRGVSSSNSNASL